MAQEGKVISVRLALFAEMMKGKPWTPATLKEVGGTEGVGVTFLEETFSAATAPPEHRYHQKAARAVLKALLPESGTDIKGHMRSHAELLEASGYASRPKDFDDLIRILDSEIRLITPTDPEGKEEADESTSQVQPGQKYYQLTHDYLVPSLRDWLTRKQKETRRGRAELLLADRAAVWNARPENRQLPSLLQWLQYPLADAEEELDAAAAEDDAQGDPVSCGAGAGGRRACWPCSAGAVTRATARLKAHALAGSAPRCRHDRSAGHRDGHGSLSPLARPAACDEAKPRGRDGQDSPQATPRQPGPVAGGRRPGGVPLRAAARRRAARSCR